MKINVLGFGVMGRQISSLLQALGHEVFVWNRAFCEDRKLSYEKQLKSLTRCLSLQTISGSVTYTNQISDLKPQMTIEVLIEELEIKKKILSLLPYSASDVELFTNTSSYSPGEIHASAVGLHFFNPIQRIKFVELTRNPAELSGNAQELIGQIQSLGYDIIQTSENRGYLGNQILFREISNVLKLVDFYGYKSHTIDKVLSHTGRAVSLFDVIDLVGVFVVKRIIENIKEIDPSVYMSPLLDTAIKNNILGKKNNTSIREVIDVEKCAERV